MRDLIRDYVRYHPHVVMFATSAAIGVLVVVGTR